jgi:transposase
MSEIKCKKCGSDNYVKCGFIDGHQRYKCKLCKMQFTMRARRGVDPGLKSFAVVLYAYCGLSMSKIAKLYQVSVVAVLKWIRKAALDIQGIEPHGRAEVIMLDEIWHFINGKKTRYGSGAQLMGYRVALSDGKSALVVMPQ